ncbi:hypothetical protein [Nonomuraea soli]|uniref:DUF2637 domain-containing protein n=1 Tax=Nonomuraea soli TaxID=1032476 RepID=A0A7W0CJJ1_9ACTN|nr:hypothetical protein [Nonomuraea soli]MBA2892100.1 hypothetical protein [Nonomuraea soli]
MNRKSRWPLLLLALPAAVATWSGWVGLGRMTGFGKVTPLPGIADSFVIDTAITLPIGVETYAAYALGAWFSSATAISPATRGFAKWSAIGSLALGMLGQVAYHLLEIAGQTKAPVLITTVVSCLPVLVLGMGAALGHMLARDLHTGLAETKEEPPVEITEVAKPPRAPRPTRSTPPRRTSKPRRAATPDVDDLMPLGWQIAADLDRQDVPLTRNRLKEAIKQTGQSISTDRAGALLARLKAEAPTGPTATVGPLPAEAA